MSNEVIINRPAAEVEIENPDAKSWYASKGIQGGVVASLMWLAALAGLDLAQLEVETVVASLVIIAGAAANIYAIIGRLTAKRSIK